MTGVKPLDKNLAGELMNRYARHKQLSATLKKLIDTYRSIAPGDTQPSDAALKQSFFPDTPSGDDAKKSDRRRQAAYLSLVRLGILSADTGKRSANQGLDTRDRRAIPPRIAVVDYPGACADDSGRTAGLLGFRAENLSFPPYQP
ncbi:MAG TPA: hypothetical protein VI358_11160 [Pseudolabrys sp.]